MPGEITSNLLSTNSRSFGTSRPDEITPSHPTSSAWRARDRTSASRSQKLTQQLHQHRIFFEVAAEYANHNAYLSEDFQKFLSGFKITSKLLGKVKDSAKEKKIDINEKEFANDLDYIKIRLKAELARSLWDNTKYYQVIMVNDSQYQKALTLFPEVKEIIAGLH